MNDELKNLDNIPTPKLTLEPVEEVTEAAIIETEAPEPAAPSLADST